MRKKDTSDVIASCAAVGADALAIFGGFILATWFRFDSGLLPLLHDAKPPHLYFMYGWGAAIATLLFLFLFRSLGLFVRPQVDTFSSKVPRLIRATGLGMLVATAFAFALRTEPPFSRLVVAISFGVILVLLLLERYILFRLELHTARQRKGTSRVLILGTDELAARLQAAIESEPRLRSRVAGFLRLDGTEQAPAVSRDRIMGGMDEFTRIIESQAVDRVILANTSLGHQRMVDIVLLCERNLVTFNLVSDLFRVLMTGVEVEMIGGIPLLGVHRWPLDFFWNRALKRIEDIAGSAIGLVLTAPLVAVAALIVKRTSPGPVFYRQERCGENGRCFTLYKLRTMRADAEAETGPVWAVEDDPRRTPFGAFIRSHNIDELPQLWNVLKGDMSLVGPRPERPHFVEQFKDDISRYMWRHVSKPGLTGWAQVNGLRGNTSIEERIKYDLYYLENWSMSFDFKILAKTFLARQNAY